MQTEIKRYVVCLKYGDKYSSAYVNRLYKMVQRNLTLDYEFYCITDNKKGLNRKIKVLPLELDPEIERGWWYKISLFDPKFPLKGTILYLDLDVIVFDNIDKFFTYMPNQFCIIEGFIKKGCVNSSCFRFETGTQKQIYHNFSLHKKRLMSLLHGDQDLIGRNHRHKVWPKNWCCSFKLDMQPSDDNLIRNEDGTYICKEKILEPSESAIAIFHGKPNPHEINDRWIKTNWK
jgi:hypothetical protein